MVGEQEGGWLERGEEYDLQQQEEQYFRKEPCIIKLS